jgi:hypothetical protein
LSGILRFGFAANRQYAEGLAAVENKAAANGAEMPGLAANFRRVAAELGQ